MTQSGVIKAAQFISGISSHQNPYRETGIALVTFFAADVVGFAGKQDGRRTTRHLRYSRRADARALYSDHKEIFESAVDETLLGGFVATRQLETPPLGAVISLSIRGRRVADECLFVGFLDKVEFSNDEIEALLAVGAVAEAALTRFRVEKDNLVGILEAVPDLTQIVSENRDIEYTNPAFRNEFGDADGEKCFAIHGDGVGPCAWCRLGDVLEGKAARWSVACEHWDKTFDVIATPLRNADGSTSMLSILRDITAMDRNRQRVERLLEEKELILREVHHRIKNNMFMMRSLLTLQRERVAEEAAREALYDAESRLASMMVLYDKLYQQERSESIVLEDFVSALMRDVLGTTRVPVEVVVDMPDVELPIRTATSLAIIVNELVTNALKYAFHDGRYNRLEITATLDGPSQPQEVALTIADNGPGFDADHSTHGFGLGLVDSLVQQLKGTVTVENNNGARITLRFVP